MSAPLLTVVTDLTCAGLAGLAVGVERERSGHASGPHGRFAGVRTFLLLGLLGGVAGWMTAERLVAIAVTALAGGMGLSVAAYVSATRRPGSTLDGTTEVAALVVLVLGLLAGMGHIGVASGVAAVVVLALSEKTRIQGLLAHVGDREMRAALQFAVMSLVVLPIMPSAPIGPGIRLRALWALVVLFSGLNFAGYLARRAVGPQRGYGVTGLLGGVASSTAVTLQFARASRHEPTAASALAVGVIGACTVLVPRVLVTSAVLNPAVAIALVPFLLPTALLGAAVVAVALRRPRQAGPARADERSASPLRFSSAIQLAVLFQVALSATALARRVWGASGVLTTAAVLGLTDVDALTVSMSRMGTTADAAALGARGVAIGIIANTFVKLALALALGSREFRRRAAGGLAGLAAAGAAGYALGTSSAVQDAVARVLAAL